MRYFSRFIKMIHSIGKGQGSIGQMRLGSDETYDNFHDEWDGWGDDEEIWVCDGCGNSEDDEGYCPMCCINDRQYSPGTEDCDFCKWEAECLGWLM